MPALASRRGAAALVLAAALALAPAALAADTDPKDLDPNDLDGARVLELIAANGRFAFDAAAADLDAARARLWTARAGLLPSLTFAAEGSRLKPSQEWQDDEYDAHGGLEVVQPLFDFGRTWGRLGAARARVDAAENEFAEARNTVLLEGLALFYDLHASELALRALNEAHASAYVTWERAKELQSMARVDAVEVADHLARVEETRLAYHRERTRNRVLRLRLQGLTGVAFGHELINPPRPPSDRPPAVDVDKALAAAEANNPRLRALAGRRDALSHERGATGPFPRLEAFGNLNRSSRELRGRDDWNVGARVVWPLFDGGRTLARRSELAALEGRAGAEHELYRRQLRVGVQESLMNLNDAWQQVVAARAALDHRKRRLLQRQRLYEQERVADLGPAMGQTTAAEAEVVRAVGAFYVERARLATLVGDTPAAGLDPDFLDRLAGAAGGQDYVPKSGSGFGQDDQKKLNRKAQ
ncbi:MAG: TolC family protein [Hyphomicrobiales bacterium]|nr:TolC family protein [Hyphomicrobiales bacterium]